MLNQAERELHARITRVLADALAKHHKEQPPLLRFQVAYEAAYGIISRARENGTPLSAVENNLARLESLEYQI